MRGGGPERHRIAGIIDRNFPGPGYQREDVFEIDIYNRHLRSWLVLLLLEEREKADTCNLNYLETDTGNITHSVTGTTETRHQDLILQIQEREINNGDRIICIIELVAEVRW